MNKFQCKIIRNNRTVQRGNDNIYLIKYVYDIILNYSCSIGHLLYRVYNKKKLHSLKKTTLILPYEHGGGGMYSFPPCIVPPVLPCIVFHPSVSVLI